MQRGKKTRGGGSITTQNLCGMAVYKMSAHSAVHNEIDRARCAQVTRTKEYIHVF